MATTKFCLAILLKHLTSLWLTQLFPTQHIWAGFFVLVNVFYGYHMCSYSCRIVSWFLWSWYHSGDLKKKRSYHWHWCPCETEIVPIFSGVHVAQSLVFYVVLKTSILVLFTCHETSTVQSVTVLLRYKYQKSNQYAHLDMLTAKPTNLFNTC